MDAAVATENAIPIEAWNSILFEKFTRYRYVLTHGLSAHSDEALRRQPYPPGARVLDIGCGWGDTTQQIAAQVGAQGQAVGVDCASRFIDAARTEAAGAQAGNCSFLVADAQADDLRGPYDFAFSRFGTMFFNLPGSALRNLRRALRPGGRLTMIVWRKREANPWVHEAEQCVRALVPVVAHEESEQVHCGPGPFSLASPDMVSDLLQSAGFARVRFERFDTEICIGRSLEDAIDFSMALGPAGEIMRLAGEEAERRSPQVMAALQKRLRPALRPDGVWMSSSSWFVSAENPAGD